VDRDTPFRQAPAGFGQRQVRLLFQPVAHQGLQGRQARAAMAAHRQAAPDASLLPTLANPMDPHAADLEATRNGRRTLTPLQRSQHPVAQILRIRVHASPLDGQGKSSTKLYLHKSKML